MLLTLRSLETQEKFLVPCVVLTKLFTGRLFTHNQLSKHINIYIQQATNTMLPFTSVCVCVCITNPTIASLITPYYYSFLFVYLSLSTSPSLLGHLCISHLSCYISHKVFDDGYGSSR